MHVRQVGNGPELGGTCELDLGGVGFGMASSFPTTPVYNENFVMHRWRSTAPGVSKIGRLNPVTILRTAWWQGPRASIGITITNSMVPMGHFLGRSACAHYRPDEHQPVYRFMVLGGTAGGPFLTP